MLGSGIDTRADKRSFVKTFADPDTRGIKGVAGDNKTMLFLFRDDVVEERMDSRSGSTYTARRVHYAFHNKTSKREIDAVGIRLVIDARNIASYDLIAWGADGGIAQELTNVTGLQVER